jgi:hypothetical protein
VESHTVTPNRAAWAGAPFVLAWNGAAALPRFEVRRAGRSAAANAPGGPSFDVCAALAAVCADVCRHVPEFAHVDPARVIVAGMQARSRRRQGLQARVTPLRFAGGELVRTSRGRLFQVQRFVVGGVDMLYVLAFCLPRFLDQEFDEKFVTIVHELYHIGPRFDGDLRRHRGRCSLHTHSKAAYDDRMARLARRYLADGANPRLHGFLRLTFDQLRKQRGRVVGVRLPRPRILPVPVELGLACRAT